jgi:DNA repair protein RecN (Recombination protein N)
MLKELHIRNFALIDKLDIDFESGFSVITGETGAGKSIVLGAIGLLMGQRADTKAIKTDAQKCSIEANFNLSAYDMKEWFDENEIDFDAEDCIIRRELTASGKSIGFINDTPATVHQMKELGEMLMDVHSQHQNLLLQKEDFQLNTVDIIAHNTKERTEYVKVFNEFHAAQKALEELNQTRQPGYTCTKTGDDLFKEIVNYRELELWGEGFNWFDYVRPISKEDIFNWRPKKEGTELKIQKRREAPKPTIPTTFPE